MGEAICDGEIPIHCSAAAFIIMEHTPEYLCAMYFKITGERKV